jgi:hypothetical protein
MTVKNVWVKDNYGNSLGWGNVQDAHGGQDITIQMSHELTEMMRWWKEWGPIFSSGDPRVVDSLMQAKTMHALTKEQ